MSSTENPEENIYHKLVSRPIEYYARRFESPSQTLRVVSFSPHPDDTEISQGGVIARHTQNADEVTVALQTRGSVAVWESHEDPEVLTTQSYVEARFKDPERQEILNILKKTDRTHEEDEVISAVNKFLRIEESKNGCAHLGVPRLNIISQDLPFYRSNADTKLPPSQRDVQKTKDLLAEKKPHIVYVADDLHDPNGTHEVCRSIVLEALHQLRDEQESNDWIDKVMVLGYRGAWHEYNLDDADMCIGLTEGDMTKKQIAMEQHKSQIPHAKYPGDDPRPFDQRAQQRNRSTQALWNNRADVTNTTQHVGMECYKEIHWNTEPRMELDIAPQIEEIKGNLVLRVLSLLEKNAA